MTILPDVLPQGLRLVFCGTAAGTASAAASAYYAGPGNRFWKTLHEIGLTDRVLMPSEYPLLPSFGIGLTDVEKTQSGDDASLRFTEASARALRERVCRAAPAVLCFNGKKAAQVALERKRVSIGLQDTTWGPTRIFVAPSTSGLATRWWRLDAWEELAREVGVDSGS